MDCCITTRDSRWFRYRAAAIIIEDGYVLFASNDRESYYYSVGGGINVGETAEEAVVREVFEETGRKYEVDRLAFIHENFFEENEGGLKGLKCHEVSFYFLMKSRGTKELDREHLEGGVHEYMTWLPIKDLDQYKAYPTFFKDKLLNMKNEIEHIITNERDN
ncbi:NUDIX domain-containing protein [uncultured Clostridium sp.]|uniref:NUDIX hydrolase n=1 Tax=uncultured Clostridium sp. TaxID=59620 RepID=UPI00261AEFB8|nr:NUDIX domain-containing protein [uncultured Clostridium sp.]